MISFTCFVPDADFTYTPGPFPAEVTDLDLNNGHAAGSCEGSNSKIPLLDPTVLILACLVVSLS